MLINKDGRTLDVPPSRVDRYLKQGWKTGTPPRTTKKAATSGDDSKDS